ncbi:MAG: hypothetical protein ABR577_15500, partial [Pyrinomonadaceae bacterium]
MARSHAMFYRSFIRLLSAAIVPSLKIKLLSLVCLPLAFCAAAANVGAQGFERSLDAPAKAFVTIRNFNGRVFVT